MSGESLFQWRDKFSQLDTCPWPGPRPLEGTDVHLLCGRDETISDFLSEVETFRVVFLTGYSGVGKTSLLQRGLVPKLKSRGYVVAVCRDWSGARTEKDVVTFLAKRVSAALEGTIDNLPNDVTIMRTLAQEYGEKAVLVLDQFEELIRDAKGFTGKLFEALASLVKFSRIKIVISLRSEQLHELRPLEHLLPPFSTTYVYLEEVQDQYIPDVIEAGNVTAQMQFGRNAIEPGVKDLIKKQWDTAKLPDELLTESPPGLLGLQALLHVLDFRAKGHPVSRQVYLDLLTELQIKGTSSDDAARLFSLALSESAEVKLQRCRTASEQAGLDDYLIEGATSVLTRAVPHLTSAGYKLVRNVRELAGLALEDELAALRRGAALSRTRALHEDGALTESQENAMFDVILRSVLATDDPSAEEGQTLDALTATRRSLAGAADNVELGQTPWAERFHDKESPFDADPGEVTSGPLMGRAPAVVMIEEYRRFALAMEWLRISHLVRFSTPMTGVVMVALIHDGFGVALKRWSEQQAALPTGPLHTLTATIQEFKWVGDDGPFNYEFDGSRMSGGSRIVVNLRWRGSSFVDTGFRRVQFVNCDLRGALFLRCVFEGVSFVNCVLDGLMFSDCTVVGRASEGPESYDDGASQFVMADSSYAAGQMSGYCAPDRRGGDVLLSDLPGFPAVPGQKGEVLEELVVESGALVIRGGRTASLSVRKAKFENGASFCLRGSAGSGFDVIEHQSAAIYEISGCVLRHVTFTTPPHAAQDAEELTIHAFDSALYQAWLGDDLKGEFVARDCTLLSVWNGSSDDRSTEDNGFTATAIEGSKYHDLVGVEPDGTCEPLGSVERMWTVKELNEPTKGRLVEMSHLMDYRRSIADEISPDAASTDVGPP